jgi:acyl carrier protein
MKSTSDIIQEVNEIFKKVFESNDLNIGMETTANDIDGWDSLSHTLMIVEAEKHFRIRFKLRELLSFKNVGDMVLAIQSKLQS